MNLKDPIRGLAAAAFSLFALGCAGTAERRTFSEP